MESTWNEPIIAHYKSNTIHLDWLLKPSQHQFRWRTFEGRWLTSKRRIRNHETLMKAIGKNFPSDLYVSTSSWLNPIDLPRLRDNDLSHPVLLDHLIVFDIDVAPLSMKNLEKAKEIAKGVHSFVMLNESVDFVHATFSGSKGFHLIYRDTDREKFGIPDPKQREETVRQERKDLLSRVLEQGFEVDERITADTRRIIRLPGSIHGKTGFQCTSIDANQFDMPLTQLLEQIPKIDHAVIIPKKAKVIVKTPVKEKKEDVVEHEHSYMMEVSNHLPGTKDRSALLFWTPHSWGTDAECFERLNTLIKIENLSFSAIFSDGERILFICPESITRAKVVKILKDLGMEKLSENLKQREHYWVRISGIMDDDGIWHNEPKFISIINNNNSKSIFSKAHLSLLTKLGIPIVRSQFEKLAGNSDPSIRMIVRD
jgi:DNA primase catalytic subunit